MSSTTKRLLLVLGLTLGVAVALGVLLHQLRTQAAALQTALQTLANEAAVERAFLSLSSVLQATVDERGQLATYVVDGEQGTIAFLSEIEALAARYQVEMKGTSLATSKSDVFATPMLTVSFTFVGPRTSTETYLRALEQLPYASYVGALTVSSASDAETNSEQLSGQLTLHVAVRNIEL